jgi:Ca2+-binding EF-hand superfamily protein
MNRFLFVTLATCLVAVTAVAADRTPAGKTAAKDTADFVFFGEKRPVLIRLHLLIGGKPYLAAWNEFIDSVFASADKNKDGVLDRDEVERLPPPQVLFSGAGPRYVVANGGNGVPTPSLALLDTNKDGKVSKEELAAYYRKNGGSPFQFNIGQSQQQMMINGLFVDVDINGRQPNGQSLADQLNDALFKLLDTNKDGKLSKEELAAAPQILARLDTDDDEMITTEEILPNTQNPYDGFVVAQPGMMNQAPPQGEPFFMIVPGESTTGLARQLLTRYAAKGKQASKKLTRKDLDLDEATFNRLDVDGDGELDSEELARFGQRPADLEMTVRLGKRDEKEPRLELAKRDGSAPAVGGVRSLSTGELVLELGNVRLQFANESRGRAVPSAEALRERYKAQFRAADTDGNGYLDMKEAQASPFFRDTFKLMDTDGDGKLFEKEMLAYLDTMLELQAKALTSIASLSASDQGRGLFDLMDTDRDGRLSVREIRNAVKLVEQLDRDGDGCISKNEIPRSYQITLGQGPLGGGGGPVRFVAVGGFPGRRGRPAPPPTAGPLWFRRMDRNRDGDVSRREWLGTEEDFRKIDLDGDGLISAGEAEKADALFRKEKEDKEQKEPKP